MYHLVVSLYPSFPTFDICLQNWGQTFLWRSEFNTPTKILYFSRLYRFDLGNLWFLTEVTFPGSILEEPVQVFMSVSRLKVWSVFGCHLLLLRALNIKQWDAAKMCFVPTRIDSTNERFWNWVLWISKKSISTLAIHKALAF